MEALTDDALVTEPTVSSAVHRSATCVQLQWSPWLQCYCHLIYSLQLLQDYVGVVNFEPYQNHFMLAYAQSRVVNVGIPGVPPLYGYPNRNW